MWRVALCVVLFHTRAPRWADEERAGWKKASSIFHVQKWDSGGESMSSRADGAPQQIKTRLHRVFGAAEVEGETCWKMLMLQRWHVNWSLTTWRCSSSMPPYRTKNVCSRMNFQWKCHQFGLRRRRGRILRLKNFFTSRRTPISREFSALLLLGSFLAGWERKFVNTMKSCEGLNQNYWGVDTKAFSSPHHVRIFDRKLSELSECSEKTLYCLQLCWLTLSSSIHQDATALTQPLLVSTFSLSGANDAKKLYTKYK